MVLLSFSLSVEVSFLLCVAIFGLNLLQILVFKELFERNDVWLWVKPVGYLGSLPHLTTLRLAQGLWGYGFWPTRIFVSTAIRAIRWGTPSCAAAAQYATASSRQWRRSSLVCLAMLSLVLLGVLMACHFFNGLCWVFAGFLVCFFNCWPFERI